MQKGMLLDTLNIKSTTVDNAIIQLGAIDDTGKGRHFVSRFIKDGLVKIEGHGIVLLKKETLDASLQSMVGTPVIIKHQNVTKENADKLRIGTISKAYFNEPDGWFYCEGIIWDEKAQDLIENKNWSVSCSYDFLAYNDEGGEENNIHYDKEFTNLNFTHLAIVDNPRYERANIVFNSKDEEKGKWVTIKGNHIFIPDGKTLDEVIKEKGWGDKKESKVSKEIDSYDRKWQNEPAKWGKEPDQETQYRKEKWEEAVKKYEEIKKKNLDWDVQKQDTKDALAEERKAYKELEIARKNSGVLSKYETLDEQESKSKKTEPEWLKQERKKLDRQTTQMYEDRYSTEHPETYKKNLEKAKDKQSDTKDEDTEIQEALGNAIDEFYSDYVDVSAKTLKKLKELSGRDISKDEVIEIARQVTFDHDWDSAIKKIKKYKTELYELVSEASDEFYGDDVTISQKTLNKINKSLGTKFSNGEINKMLSQNHIKYGNEFINKTVEDLLKKPKNKTNNSKENDMAILEELKKFIFKIENEKENEMDSKSKILSILNEKEVDEETIEEIKNELEKIEEEKKEVENKKKVKNEEKEEVEEKDEKEEKVENEDEEDKKEVKEVKEEVKEDVDNKCKNSKEDTSSFDKINEIYNSVRQLKETKTYVSRQEKLDNAVEYFK